MMKRIIACLSLLLALTLVFPVELAPQLSTAIQVQAASVKLSRTGVYLVKGMSTTLKVTGTTQKVKWSTSDKSIATVTQNGKVTGVKKGLVTITTTVGGKKLTCKVKVNNRLGAASNSVSLKEASKDLNIYFNGSGAVRCKVEDPDILSLNWKNNWKNKSRTLTFTGKSSGETNIILTNTQNSEELTVRVKVTMPELDADSMEMDIGDKIKLVLEGASSTIKWSSTDKTVATVSSKGTVTAKAAGKATIIAKHGGRFYRCSVSVDGEGSLLTPEVENGSWHFEMKLKNKSSSKLSLQKLEIIDYRDGKTVGDPWVRSGSELGSVGLANVTLKKGETRTWDDWHPVVTRYDRRDYVYTFKDANGKTIKQSFCYDLSAQYNDLNGTTCGIGLDATKDGGSWAFKLIAENNTDSTLTLQKLEIKKYLDGKEWDKFTYTSESFGMLQLTKTVLKSGEFFFWEDWHPVVNDFNTMEFSFVFKDSKGNTVKQVFSYELSLASYDFTENKEKDLITLRHDANFNVKVADGIYWVPASTLGDSRYTNDKVIDMLTLTPSKKQSSFKTLYEALQLYQVGNFYSSDDNIRIFENGVNWEHHKPGYDAVRTNNGCCATSANWLNYILKGDYDEVGYIATSQSDGSGHIYNYIKQDGWYYIIDMTHYRTDWIATPLESGDINDFRSSDIVNGAILKTKSLSKYVDYVQSNHFDPPAFMTMYTAENCVAVDGERRPDGVTIIYEKNPDIKIKVLYDNLDFVYKTAPKNLPDWSQASSYKFK